MSQARSWCAKQPCQQDRHRHRPASNTTCTQPSHEERQERTVNTRPATKPAALATRRTAGRTPHQPTSRQRPVHRPGQNQSQARTHRCLHDLAARSDMARTGRPLQTHTGFVAQPPGLGGSVLPTVGRPSPTAGGGTEGHLPSNGRHTGVPNSTHEATGINRIKLKLTIAHEVTRQNRIVP